MYRLGLLAISTLMMATVAQAEVYKWQDADGKTHFGDKKPQAAQVETLNIPTTPATPNAPSSNNNYLERQKKLLDAMRSEREAKEAKEQKQAKQQANLQRNCVELQDYIKRLTNSGKLYHLSEKGERIYASDAEFNEELQSSQQSYKQYCR